MKQNGYTLIEILLSLLLMLLLVGACVFNMGAATNQFNIDNKVINYTSLNQYAKCNAALLDAKCKIVVENNKLRVISEKFDGTLKDVSGLKDQLETLNDKTFYQSEEYDVVVYLPDGAVEKIGDLSMNLEGDETNVVIMSINEWNKVNVVYTNSTQEIDDMEMDLW